MKKLRLNQETVKHLTLIRSNLEKVQGGNVSSNCPTEICAADTGAIACSSGVRVDSYSGCGLC